MTEQLDILIGQLANINTQKKSLAKLEEATKEKLTASLKEADMDGYKVEGVASVSIVTSYKPVVKDEKALFAELERRGLKDCYETVTKVSLTKNFTEYVKSGDLEIEGVSVVKSESIYPRYA